MIEQISLVGKKVAIVGAGVEGQAMAKYVSAHGAAEIVLFDEKFVEKIHVQSNVSLAGNADLRSLRSEDFDLVFRSPSVHLKKLAAVAGRVTSMTNWFFAHCKGKIVGVTGTKGKGTTSTMLAQMLEKSGKKVWFGGNVGVPMIEFLDRVEENDIVVLELSSFQTMDLRYSPQMAIIVMVTSDHLDVHTNLAEYREAKKQLLRAQKPEDSIIFFADCEGSKEVASASQAQHRFEVSKSHTVESGAFYDTVGNADLHSLQFAKNGISIEILPVSDIALFGSHHLENIAAAAIAAYEMGVSIEVIAAVLREFRGLPHRLQLVHEANRIKFFDDSISTAPDTAMSAISAFIEPLVVILGGSSKGADFTKLAQFLATQSHVRGVVCIGKEGDHIEKKLRVVGGNFSIKTGAKNMEDAIVQAVSCLSSNGGVVLLSPACASFDWFKNAYDRGDQFIDVVKKY